MKKMLWLPIAAVTVMLALPVHAGGKDHLPRKLSRANGWHGFQLKREGNECTPTFPKNFGATPQELRFLEKLATLGDKFQDIDCMLDVYAALDQIKRLAVEQQNAAAARLILFAPETGTFNLDGEVAEGFANLYQTPVLTGYNKLRALIPPAKEAALARDVCVGMFYGDTEEIPDEDALLAHLKAVHMQALAAKVKRGCDKEGKAFEVDNAAGR